MGSKQYGRWEEWGLSTARIQASQKRYLLPQLQIRYDAMLSSVGWGRQEELQSHEYLPWFSRAWVWVQT